jgi:hypothetical protein
MKMITQQLAKIKELVIKYRLILLGCFIFALYFWNRFLRIRTSKYLPLELTILKFFSILSICFLFFYIVISLLFPRKVNPIMEEIINWFFIPIAELDKWSKNLTFIKPYYQKILNKIIPLLTYLIIKTNLFYLIFWMLPRMILMTALFIDVFIFHQLHYKYVVLLFGLLLFFNRYLKYSLKNSKDEMIKELQPNIQSIVTEYWPYVHPSELEPDYDPDDPDNSDLPPTMSLPLDIFIKFQTDSINQRNVTNSMLIHPTLPWMNNILKEYNRPPLEKNSSEDDFNFCFQKTKEILMPQVENIVKISLIIEHYTITSNKNQKINNIKVLIYLNYLLCWLYVLIVSIETLDSNALLYLLNQTWENIQGPF